MLTNWNTIQNSIKRLKYLDDQLSKDNMGFTKKEIIKFGKERDKLQRSIGGISEMKKIPNIIFIIDTNSDPTGIDFPIPGNDDARRSINLYCDLLANTIKDAEKFIEKNTEEKKTPQVDQKKTKPKIIKIEKKNFQKR